ncbi:hypothetical protein [Acaryochloris sp. CCMEE 5410]|uniref:hypothetical protein n=1 Tax=Acaryochloris sp. CCMEE 5410 TaxID=310037 RepID=UPI000248530F|nr:hypothetical protein [Acaryochloris sp. CCMEE 5410]KAI9133746.1 hypothetical protein ON05_010880 [Acaryochloris sp. CCMEE 5410]
MENDRFIDLPSIRQYFPLSIALPERLVELLTVLNQKYRYNSCGPFFLGEFFDDYYIKNGSDLAEYFGFFILDSGDMSIGYWFYEGCSPENAPIVAVIDYRGTVLATSLEELLERMIQNTFWDVYDRSSFETRPDNGWIDEADIWLRESLHITPRTCEELSFDPGKHHPDLNDWLDKKHWQQYEKADPLEKKINQQIANIMSPYFPQKSAYKQFAIQIAGSCFEEYCNAIRSEHMTLLEPLIHQFRELRSRTHPENKRCFEIHLGLSSDGEASLTGYFDHVPTFRKCKPTLQNYIDDLRLAVNPNPRLSREFNLELLRLSLVEDCHATFIQTYPHLVQFDPDDDLSWSQYGDLLVQFKHYKAAISAYNNVLADDFNRQDIVEKRDQAQHAIQHQ